MHPMYAESFWSSAHRDDCPDAGDGFWNDRFRGHPTGTQWDVIPYFPARIGGELYADLEQIGEGLVSLALVTDPFGEYDVAYLQRCFRDVVIPFKEHYVADLSLPLQDIAGRRHRKNGRRALKEIEVDAWAKPIEFLKTWVTLYRCLIEKHDVSGISAFSRDSFAKQLSIPGAEVLTASYHGATVGAQIYLMQADVVHCHLGAADQAGYDAGAIYALDYYSIEYFAGKARWLNLGGGAGINSNGADGLSLYKKGWTNETRTAYFCGRILNPKKYAEIVSSRGLADGDYFPAYRKGEFG